jgi:hypothetical protein
MTLGPEPFFDRVAFDEAGKCHGQIVIAERMSIAFGARTVKPDYPMSETFSASSAIFCSSSVMVKVSYRSPISLPAVADFETVCDFSSGRF